MFVLNSYLERKLDKNVLKKTAGVELLRLCFSACHEHKACCVLAPLFEGNKKQSLHPLMIRFYGTSSVTSSCIFSVLVKKIRTKVSQTLVTILKGYLEKPILKKNLIKLPF